MIFPLGDSRLLQSLLDLGLFKPHDHFLADDQGRSGFSSGLLGQFFQVFRVFDHVLFNEGNPFLREKLSRRLAGVSSRIEVHDNRLRHDALLKKVSGFGFKVGHSKIRFKLGT